MLKKGRRELQIYTFRADDVSYVGMTGLLDPVEYYPGKSYAFDTLLSCTDYDYLYVLTEDLNKLFPEMLKRTDELLKSEPGLNIAHLGFIAY